MYLKAIGWWGMDWIHVCQDMAKQQAVASTWAIKCGECLDSLWNCCAFKKSCVVLGWLVCGLVG
jgi:hypothetical protein